MMSAIRRGSSRSLFNTATRSLSSSIVTQSRAAVNVNDKKVVLNHYQATPMGVVGQKPTVVVLGWLGATKKHLSHFVKIYEDMGLNVIPYIPGFTYMLPTSSVADGAQELLQEELYELTGRPFDTAFLAQKTGNDAVSKPILVHSLSTGGTSFLANVLMEDVYSGDPRIPDSLAGVLCDSGPSNALPATYARGFTAALKYKFGLTTPKGQDPYHHPVITPILETAFAWYNNRFSIKNRYVRMRSALGSMVTHDTPWHFAIGEGDTLCKPWMVENFAKGQEWLGFPVTVTRFPKAEHLECLRSDHEAYVSMCQRFVDDSMDRWDQVQGLGLDLSPKELEAMGALNVPNPSIDESAVPEKYLHEPKNANPAAMYADKPAAHSEDDDIPKSTVDRMMEAAAGQKERLAQKAAVKEDNSALKRARDAVNTAALDRLIGGSAKPKNQ